MPDLIRSTFAILIAITPLARLSAQCAVNSSNGYVVNLHVRPVSVVPSGDNCPYGYSYKVLMAYDVTFTGSNVPGSMNTLQGTITCGSTNIFFNLPNTGGSGTVLSSNAYTPRTDCATVSPSALSCNTVNIQIAGPSLSNRTIVCSFSTLPVELVSFDARAHNGSVELDWSTASERNNDHFTIERAADANAFVEIAQVPAVGNSTAIQHYRTSDPAPLNDIAYYRLRQTDMDGTSTLSSVVAVRSHAPSTLTLFPNPLQGDVLHTSSNENGNTLYIYAASGALVHAETLSGTSVALPPLPAGIYETRLLDPRTSVVRSARLIKE